MTGIQPQGFDVLADSLRDVVPQIVNPEAHAEAGALLLDRAHPVTPRRTGALDNSQHVTVTETGATLTASTPYAGFVHAREPWLSDTAAAASDDVLQVYARHADEALNTIKGT